MDEKIIEKLKKEVERTVLVRGALVGKIVKEIKEGCEVFTYKTIIKAKEIKFI